MATLSLDDIRTFAIEIHNIWRANANLEPHEAAERLSSEMDGTQHEELIDAALEYALEFVFQTS